MAENWSWSWPSALRDRTSEIAAQLAQSDPRVRLVGNPIGRTPNGLNAAISAARHQIIARVDGHGVLSPDTSGALSRNFSRRAPPASAASCGRRADGLRTCGGAGHDHAIRHRQGPLSPRRRSRPAGTVYLGIFRREVIERLGGYDEHFARAQDWELNHRIRAAGETVWFTPDLEVTYRPRGSLGALGGTVLPERRMAP